MRKIIYWVHTSVDGFIDGPNGEFDWPVMGPELSAYSEGDEWTTRVVRGDLQAEVTALKAQPGADLLLTGGVSLAAALTDLGLVDEYHIAVHPRGPRRRPQAVRGAQAAPPSADRGVPPTRRPGR